MNRKLPNGFEEIETRNGKRIKVTISYGSGVERKRKSKTFNDLSSAKLWRNQMEIDRSENITYFADDYLVADAFELYLNKYKKDKVEEATLVTYIGTLKMLRREWSQVKIKDVSRHVVQDLMNNLIQKGLTKNTLKKYRIHLKAFFNMLVTDGAMRRSPLDSLVDIRGAASGKKPEEKVLSITQYKALLSYLKNSNLEKMSVYEVVILVILVTGFRVSEATDLRWDDVDEINSKIRVDSSYSRITKSSKAPKTKNSYRTVPVPKFILNTLSDWRIIQQRQMMGRGFRNKDDHIFLTKYGNVPDMVMVNYWVHKLEARVLNIPKEKQTSTHSLRHTVASFYLSTEGGNQSIQMVASLLGDSITMVEEVYVHLMPEEMKAKSEQLKELMENI